MRPNPTFTLFVVETKSERHPQHITRDRNALYLEMWRELETKGNLIEASKVFGTGMEVHLPALQWFRSKHVHPVKLVCNEFINVQSPSERKIVSDTEPLV